MLIFLEYWQGERKSLCVRGADSRIDDFNPIDDFEIVEDVDGVLNMHEATVRCIVRDYDGYFGSGLKYGHEYRSIGFDDSGRILVMDESSDCYFYPRESFEITEDKHGVLDEAVSSHIYDWENTHVDSV